MKIVVKVIISFYQVIGSFLDVYDIPWPPAVHDVLLKLQAFQLDVFALPVAGCIYPNPDYFTTFNMYMAFPIVLNGFIFGVLSLMLKYRIDVNNKALRKQLKDHVQTTWLFVLYLMYPVLCAKVKSPYAARHKQSKQEVSTSMQYDGRLLMKPNFVMSCCTQHIRYVHIAHPMACRQQLQTCYDCSAALLTSNAFKSMQGAL